MRHPWIRRHFGESVNSSSFISTPTVQAGYVPLRSSKFKGSVVSNSVTESLDL